MIAGHIGPCVIVLNAHCLGPSIDLAAVLPVEHTVICVGRDHRKQDQGGTEDQSRCGDSRRKQTAATAAAAVIAAVAKVVAATPTIARIEYNHAKDAAI